MKRFILFALILSLAFAGCFGKKSDNTATPDDNATPGASSSPPMSTPSGTDTNATPPMAVAPKDIKSGTVTWPTDCSAVAGTAPTTNACPSIAFTVDPGYKTLNFTVVWSCNSGLPACGSNGAVLSAGGLSCTAPQTISPQSAATDLNCNKTGPAAAGKILAAGDGTVVATYKLSES
jgi:hypothetical protein